MSTQLVDTFPPGPVDDMHYVPTLTDVCCCGDPNCPDVASHPAVIKRQKEERR